MFENKQKTLTKAIKFVGTGLHLGKKASINLEPAEADTGIIFKRTDIKNNNEIKANYTNVSSAKLCTKIENDHGISVSTINRQVEKGTFPPKHKLSPQRVEFLKYQIDQWIDGKRDNFYL